MRFVTHRKRGNQTNRGKGERQDSGHPADLDLIFGWKLGFGFSPLAPRQRHVGNLVRYLALIRSKNWRRTTVILRSWRTPFRKDLLPAYRRMFDAKSRRKRAAELKSWGTPSNTSPMNLCTMGAQSMRITEGCRRFNLWRHSTGSSTSHAGWSRRFENEFDRCFTAF